MKRNPLLRLLLAIVDTGWWLAPLSRRREWRRQWRADILHEWQWLTRHPRGVGDRASLFVRAAGALRHAFWLRLHVRRLEMITQDLRYGWRLMVRKPGITAVAVLTLGLGIGANATVYSWIETGLRRPLPGVADPDRVVVMDAMTGTRDTIAVSYPDFVDYRAHRPQGVDDIVTYTFVPMSLRTGGESQRVWGQLVSGNYFDMLGVRAALGRTFAPEEDRTTGRNPVVVLSHRFWQRHFDGDRNVLGQTVTLNSHPFMVIGVADEAFRGNEPFLSMDLWVPMMMQPAIMAGDRLTARGLPFLQTMARLKRGATLARVQADLDVISRNLASTYADDADRSVRLYEVWRAPGRSGATMLPGLTVLMAFAGVVLLVACANVANLLLARAVNRQRETAVRLALGASRRRLVQQLLTESALLAAAGGLAGVIIAYWTATLITTLVPPMPIPLVFEASLTAPVLAFTMLVTAVSALAFGLAPALQHSAATMLSALKASAASVTASPSRARVRRGLVIAQVSASLVLLVSASLFMRTLRNAQAVDPGVSTRSGLLASIDLTPAGYDEARGRAFYRDLLARVRTIPGVEAATLASRVPLIFWSSGDVRAKVDGYTPALNEDVIVDSSRIGSDYLRTMGIGLVEGREFTDRDTADRPDVGIINETLARRYFAGRSPIGGRIGVGSRTVEVVGVARDGKYTWITELPRPYLYVSSSQWYRADSILHVKTANPGAVVPAIQQAVRALDTNVPLYEVRTIAEHLTLATFLQRQLAAVLGAFGALALLLSMVGLYGVIAATVAQRTPEIGMRMALGASRMDIAALVLKESLTLTLAGVALGLGGAFAVTRLFKSLLVGVSATDAVSFAGTAAILVVVSLVATYLPARRAAVLDPTQALRQE
jgi:predicted permease